MATALVAAESLMALTPIIIKKTAVDHLTAIWSRMLTAGVVGYSVSAEKELSKDELGFAGLLGYTNLLHLSSSYEGFRNLPAGQAMSIFYTYPLWILILNNFFNNEEFTRVDYGCIGLAAAGSALLNYNPGKTPTAASKDSEKPHAGWGIFNMVAASVTEAGMHVILKHLGWVDAGKSVWVVSAFSSAWLAIFLFFQGLFGFAYPPIQGSLADIGYLTVFHGFSTFVGYYLRFFAVPRLPTITYSLLSYTGLLASYIFGLLFLGERPGLVSLAGGLLILASGVYLVTSKGL
jgi:drug/metabolite transporter (DMT)-like permease